MAIVSLKDAKNRLTELARRVEQGETIVVTRNGKPVLDLVPHREKGGVDLEAGRAYLRSIGVTNPVPYIADDFDDPLPEDFLITRFPPELK
jgi:prevent-host-death family protein